MERAEILRLHELQLEREEREAEAKLPQTVLQKIDKVVDEQPQKGGLICTLSETERKPTKWLWKGKIPLGAFSLFTAEAGTGKTTLAAWIAAGVTNGTLAGELKGVPSNVLYLAVEDDYAEDIHPRMDVAGADLSRIKYIKAENTVIFPGFVPAFIQTVLDNNIKLVVLDPLITFLNVKNENSRSEIRHAMTKLVGAIQETGCSLVGIHHTNKDRTLTLAQRTTGSSAYRELARSCLFLVKDFDDPNLRIFGVEKTNKAEAHIDSSIQFKAELVTLPDGVVTTKMDIDTTLDGNIADHYERYQAKVEDARKGASADTKKTNQRRIRELIFEAFSTDGASRKEIVDHVQDSGKIVSIPTVDRHLAAMVKAGWISTNDAGTHQRRYYLRVGHEEALDA